MTESQKIKTIDFSNVLIVEDSDDDAALILREFKKNGYKPEIKHVNNDKDLVAEISNTNWDIVLLDYDFPGSDFEERLRLIREYAPNLPVVVVTEAISETCAVEIVKDGAKDLVPKDQLERLIPAILRSLYEKQLRDERDKARAQLAQNEKRFRDFASLGADWYWEADTKGVYTYFSPHSLYEFNGYKSSDFVGWSRKRLCEHLKVDEDDLGELNEIIADERSFHELRFTFQHPRLGDRIVSLSALPHYDDNGIYCGYRGIGKDISEKIQSRRKVEESEHLLRTVLDYAPAPISLKNERGQILLANKSCRESLGLADSDIMGRTVYEVFPNFEEAEKIAKLETSCLATGNAASEEVRLSGANFSSHDFLVTAFPVRSLGDDVKLIGTIATDITDIRSAERKLAKSERRYRTILDEAPIMVTLKDREGRYLLTNRSFREHFEINNEIISEDEIFEESSAQRFKENFCKVLYNGNIVTDEIRWPDQNGNERDNLIRYFPLVGENGDVEQVGAVSVDITEMREVERSLQLRESQLKGLLDNAPISIMLKDIDGRYSLVNRNFCERFGASEEDILNSYGSEVFPKQISHNTKIWDRQILQTGQPITHEEKLRTEDGKEREFLVTNFPIYDTDDKIIQIGAVSIDITQRKHVERQLIQSQKMEAVGQLTAGIAHDFNNLLTVIVGNAAILSEELAQDETLSEMAELIDQAGQGAAEMIARLLSFSRRQSLSERVTDIGKIVNDLNALLCHSLGELVEVEIDIKDDIRPVRLDPSQLETVILNLAINARDAMPEGGKLRITAKEIANDTVGFDSALMPDDYVELTLSDNGSGISPDNLDRVIEPFFTTKDAGRGTGMGLSMAYGFARQSGGDLQISSQVGRGTDISIFLPVSKESSEEIQFEQKENTVEQGPVKTGQRILVVEDNDMLRQWVCKNLSLLGYDVDSADSGVEALEILEENKNYDVVFSDIVMPKGVSGLDVAEEILTNYPSTRVLLTTGYAKWDASNYPKFAESGQILRKPFSRDQLNKMIQLVLASD